MDKRPTLQNLVFLIDRRHLFLVRGRGPKSAHTAKQSFNRRTKGCRWHFSRLPSIFTFFIALWLTLSAQSGFFHKRISDFSKSSADTIFVSIFLLCSNQIVYFFQYNQIFKTVEHLLKLEIGGALIKALSDSVRPFRSST
jgi:hypothetical protein